MKRSRSLVAFVAALVLAGCQSAQSTQPPSASTPSGAAATTTPQPTPVAIVSPAPTASAARPSAAVLGPGRWIDAGSSTVTFYGPRAVELADGRVLVVGDAYRGDEWVPASELWDPATGRWTATQPLNAIRHQFALVALRDGRALVAGGENAARTSYSSAYIFDPATGAWSKTGLMATARSAPSAALLPDGRVLVAAGFYRANSSSGLDPDVALATYHDTGAEPGPRLADVDVPPSGYALASAEIFDPATGSWSPAANLRYARTGAAATVLGDGRVLLVGSIDYNVNRLDEAAYGTAEVYDPGADRFVLAGTLPDLDRAAIEKLGKPGANPVPHEDPDLRFSPGHLVATPGSDAVLIADWSEWKHVGIVSRSFRYDGAAARWSEIGETFIRVAEPGVVELYHEGVLNRSEAAVAALPDGRVLIAGGSGPVQRVNDYLDTLTTAEVAAYDARASAWTTLSRLPEPRSGAVAVALRDGSVVVFGGSHRTADGSDDYTSAVRFVPGD